MNVILYFSVVLIWGTTWIAISAQHGELSPVVGVFWRFILAASLLFLVLLFSKRLQPMKVKDHLFCLLQGLCVFGFNFICFYTAVAYINSGLESVIFSMAILFNAINSKLFFKTNISKYFYPSAFFGFAGILALFWQDLIGNNIQWQTLMGVALCLVGTLGFSLGNMVSIRHQRHGLDVFSTNAFGMLYGAIVVGMIGLLMKENFFPVISSSALFALLYLAIFGSVIGFAGYFILIGRVGADQAAYSTLLFPLVALSISTVWENYHWYPSSFLGMFFILLGNYILFAKPKWVFNLVSKVTAKRKKTVKN